MSSGVPYTGSRVSSPAYQAAAAAASFGPVLPGRRHHADGHQLAERVGDDEPFPAIDLLGVVAARFAADGVGALDVLRVDDAGGRLGDRAPVRCGPARATG